MGGNGPEWVELKLDVSAEFQAPPLWVLPESGRLFAGLSAPTGAGVQGRRGVGEKKLFPALTAPLKIAKNGGVMYPYPTTLP